MAAADQSDCTVDGWGVARSTHCRRRRPGPSAAMDFSTSPHWLICAACSSGPENTKRSPPVTETTAVSSLRRPTRSASSPASDPSRVVASKRSRPSSGGSCSGVAVLDSGSQLPAAAAAPPGTGTTAPTCGDRCGRGVRPRGRTFAVDLRRVLGAISGAGRTAGSAWPVNVAPSAVVPVAVLTPHQPRLAARSVASPTGPDRAPGGSRSARTVRPGRAPWCPGAGRRASGPWRTRSRGARA